MKVIIGIDDSPCSNAALDWVGKMVWPPATRFIVLSVAEPVFAMVEPGGIATAGWDAEATVREHEGMVARAELSLKEVGLKAAGRVERGSPKDAIVHVAEAEKADLVIVGSHGRSGLTRLIMGSVASHVITHAPCSVLVAR